MIDHLATTHSLHPGTPSAALVDLSARPTAPTSAGRDRRRLPARARLAAALRQVAAAVEPRPATSRSRGTAPACQ